MENFSIYAGYHENIIATKNELDKYFAKWQQYGIYTQEKLEEFYFESENSCIFTKKAYNKYPCFRLG